MVMGQSLLQLSIMGFLYYHYQIHVVLPDPVSATITTHEYLSTAYYISLSTNNSLRYCGTESVIDQHRVYGCLPELSLYR